MSLALCFLLTSCLTPSENPIYLQSGSEVSPNPYLGEWLLTEHGGDPVEWTISIEITQDATQMLIAGVSPDNVPPMDVYFYLTEIDEEVIFCVRHPANGLWLNFIGELEDNNTRLSLRRLDEEVIEGDILADDLAGFSRTVADRHSVVIRASQGDLRTYIENTPEAFEEEPYLVFEKVE